MEKFTEDEMNILSTAMVALVDSKLCTRKQDGRYVFRCSDGKKRKFKEHQVLELMDKIASHAGHEGVKDEALNLAEEVGIREQKK